jgi:hypothetical protein
VWREDQKVFEEDGMRNVVHSLAVSVMFLSAAFLSQPLKAQPFTLDEKIKPVELKLDEYKTDDPRAQGRIAQAFFTQTENTQYYFVRGISIFSPDYVSITTDDPSAGIKISLHKDNWDQAVASGQTGGGGHWETSFKTSGDFGIKVVTDKLPARYSLVVWVGKEVSLRLPSPFTQSAGLAGGGHGFSSNVLLMAIGVLVIIVAALAVLLFRSKSKSKTTAACIIVGLFLSASPSLKAQLDASTIAKAMDYFKKFLEITQNAEKMWNDSKTLSPNEASPDFGQRGPTMPSSCAGDALASEECRCFAKSAERLDKNRVMLEKLRVLVANQKAFKDKAIALGNSYAQLHTLMGIQWVGIRKHDIEEPYEQFKTISNQKHQLVMGAIQESLKDISACEARMGERDWYQKYGFIYYEFLYDAYKPSF